MTQMKIQQVVNRGSRILRKSKINYILADNPEKLPIEIQMPKYSHKITRLYFLFNLQNSDEGDEKIYSRHL